MKRKNKGIVVGLAAISKRRVENWMRRLMSDIRDGDANRAERLMRVMQGLSNECDRLDSEWASCFKGQLT